MQRRRNWKRTVCEIFWLDLVGMRFIDWPAIFRYHIQLRTITTQLRHLKYRCFSGKYLWNGTIGCQADLDIDFSVSWVLSPIKALMHFYPFSDFQFLDILLYEGCPKINGVFSENFPLSHVFLSLISFFIRVRSYYTPFEARSMDVLYMYVLRDDGISAAIAAGGDAKATGIKWSWCHDRCGMSRWRCWF